MNGNDQRLDLSDYPTEENRIQEFKKNYPQYADERFEICDNGDVFVHGNCAYPLIIRKAVDIQEQ